MSQASEDDFPRPQTSERVELKDIVRKPDSQTAAQAADPEVQHAGGSNAFEAFKCKRMGSDGATTPAPTAGGAMVNGSAHAVPRGSDSMRHTSTDDRTAAADTTVQMEHVSPSPQVLGRKKRKPAVAADTPAGRKAIKRNQIQGLEESDDEADEAQPAAAAEPVPETPAGTIDLTTDAVTPIAIDLAADDGPTDSPPEQAAAADALRHADAAAGPLEKCEAIAARISAALREQQQRTTDQDRAQVDLSIVKPDLVAAACGGASDQLKEYQLVGLNFMLLLKRLDVGGCILADEMGLGKTAQACCFLGTLKGVEDDPGPHLVVAPASLLENWQRELQRWSPSLRVSLYHGKSRWDVRDDFDDWRHAHEAGEEGGFPFNVLLTTYTLFERDSADQRDDRKFLRRVRDCRQPWSHVVLDEAHAIKSKSASRTVRLRALADSCKRRLFLTGTPLQNDLTELRTLLQLLLPDVFDADSDGQLDALEEELSEEELTARMRSLLEPFLLRRLKEHVANQLAPKKQVEQRLEMLPAQARLYASAVERLRSELRAGGNGDKSGGADSNGTAGPGRPDGRDAAAPALKMPQKKINNLFVHLRKIAQHPLLVRSAFSDDTLEKVATLAYRRGDFGERATLPQVQRELTEYSDHRLHHFCAASKDKRLRAFALDPQKMRDSAKFRHLAELLPRLRERGSRPLIFSQWTALLDLLEWFMQDLGLKYVRLDGSTAVQQRLTIVDSFNNDSGIFAFLLSTRAGGQGLNLTGADTVILHDCDFNPQIDRQAEDRCHRLGQERPVTIHRLITQGTVDSDILDIAQRKLRLDAAVLSGISGSATDAAGAETRAMSDILSDLLAK